MNLQRIKERISKYKEEIDEAEERELTARTALIEADTRVEKTLDEVEGVKRRVVLLTKDLENTRERLAKHDQKLNLVEDRSGNDDELRQQFEETEFERDEKLAALEEECVNARKVKDEAHTVLMESERKLAVVEGELQRAEERLANAERNVERLEEKINEVGVEIRDLEGRDWEAAERETLSNEKMKFLTDQLRVAVENSEGFERDVKKYDELTASYRNEIQSWKVKIQGIQNECKSIENLADEQIELHSDTRRPPSPEPEPEEEPEEEPEDED